MPSSCRVPYSFVGATPVVMADGSTTEFERLREHVRRDAQLIVTEACIDAQRIREEAAAILRRARREAWKIRGTVPAQGCHACTTVAMAVSAHDR